MNTSDHYRKSLLYLSYLIINADGVLDESESKALEKICEFEGIEKEMLDTFLEDVKKMTERRVYEISVDEIILCSEEEKVKAFAWLYRISEADGKVHAKEVRFLLYASRLMGIKLDDIIEYSKNYPSLEITSFK